MRDPPPGAPGGGSKLYKLDARKPKVFTRIRQSIVAFRRVIAHSRRSRVRRSTLLIRKYIFVARTVLGIASDVLNSSHRVSRRTFSDFLRCRCLEANLRRESSVVPRVERYRTLRLIASACCLFNVCCCEYKLLQLSSSLPVSYFQGKPFVAIKLVITQHRCVYKLLTGFEAAESLLIV